MRALSQAQDWGCRRAALSPAGEALWASVLGEPFPAVSKAPPPPPKAPHRLLAWLHARRGRRATAEHPSIHAMDLSGLRRVAALWSRASKKPDGRSTLERSKKPGRMVLVHASPKRLRRGPSANGGRHVPDSRRELNGRFRAVIGSAAAPAPGDGWGRRGPPLSVA